MQNRALAAALPLLIAAGAGAQIYVPASSQPNLGELNSRSNYPLMRASSRAQVVLAQGEIGSPTTLTQLALRYDGPSYGVSGGTMGQIDLYLGPASKPPDQSSALFDANLQGSPTLVGSYSSRAFPADTSPNPSVWGGPNGELLFVFNTPYVYGGGPLVVELRCTGNTNSGLSASNCLLDTEEDPATGPAGGTTTSNGAGCNGASLSVAGQLAPFGAISCHGSGFTAGQPVVSILGSSLTAWGPIPLPLDLAVVGGDGCWLHNDWITTLTTLADPTGSVPAYTPALTWPVPADPALSGATLQFQILAAKAGNPLGIATTNNVQVKLGGYTTLTRGYAAHFHHMDSNAQVASLNLPATFAMRFN
jgi:hypothetical protein